RAQPRVPAPPHADLGGPRSTLRRLFAVAQAAGLATAVVGRPGAAFLQDLRGDTSFVGADPVQPRRADAVRFETTAFDPAGQVAIPAHDASDRSQGAADDASNRSLLSVYTRVILPRRRPMLSLIWFRTPGSEDADYGPGSANARAGLRAQDARLGELQAALRDQGLARTTNVIVVSDHGDSSVSGPLALYPLRAIEPSAGPPDGPPADGATSGRTAARIGRVDPVGGYAFSGDLRSADLLTYRGFKAYDGRGCEASPMSGLDAQGLPTLPLVVDATGALCGRAGEVFQALSATRARPLVRFEVPAPGRPPGDAIIVAAHGASEYFYLPGHGAALLRRLVTFLQQREEYGAIFVDTRYGAVPGTFPLDAIGLEDPQRRDPGRPDVVVSYSWDDQAVVQGLRGIEFESFGAGRRGVHGGFAPADVHATLIASGPSFRRATTVTDPSGNVDLAPTLAHVLGLALPQADGRILDEALVAPASRSRPRVVARRLHPAADVSGLRFERPTDPGGASADAALDGHYSAELAVKDLTVDGRTYRYFDSARALRR
ncbi:MAG: alkaline phosphatase family protein, partial [Burkholderiales bacterium]|nr:alkaline phosphatase family protein [Burkholderiales bacterium]